MVRKQDRRIPAGEFEAKCLELVDEVAETGERIVITRGGRAVAVLGPKDDAPTHPDREELKVKLLGSVEYEGDLLAPVKVRWGTD